MNIEGKRETRIKKFKNQFFLYTEDNNCELYVKIPLIRNGRCLGQVFRI